MNSEVGNSLVSLPRQVLRIGFWWRHRVLLAISSSGLGIFLLFLGKTHPSGLGLLAHLSTAILILALAGFVITVRCAARIEVDEFVADAVGDRTRSALDRLRAKAIARVALDSLREWIPNYVHWRAGSVQMFQMVVDEAQDRKYHSPTILAQPFRERSTSDLQSIRTLQKLTLQLGILGTFLGLLQAISSLPGDAMAEQSTIPELLLSLQLAFGTSIAGLEASIALGLMGMFLHGRLEALWGLAESTVKDFTVLARRTEVVDEYLVEFSQLRESLNQLRRRIAGHASTVRLQTDEIQSGLTRLSEVKDQFDGFLGSVRLEQASVLEEFKSVYELVSPRKAAEELEEGISRTVAKVVDSFQSGLDNGLEQLGSYRGSLEAFREMQVDWRTDTRMVLDRIERVHQLADSRGEASVRHLEGLLGAQKKLLDRLDSAVFPDIALVPEKLDKLVEIASRQARDEVRESNGVLQAGLADQLRAQRRTNFLLQKLVERPGIHEFLFAKPYQRLSTTASSGWQWLRSQLFNRGRSGDSV